MQKLPPAQGAGRGGSGGRGRLGRRRRHEDVPEVFGITTARTGQHDDMSKRARRYMVSMLIRLVCLVLAFVFFGTWEAWLFAGGAVVLPYIAVLMANAGGERPSAPPTSMMSPEAAAAQGTSPPGAQPRSVRSIGAVPARTTPAADPWADTRVGRPGPPRGSGSSASWQHSYAPPGSEHVRGVRPAPLRRGTRAS